MHPVLAVVRRLRSGGQDSRAAELDVLRWAVTGLGALAVLGGWRYAALEPVVVAVWLVSLAALLVALYRAAYVSGRASTG